MDDILVATGQILNREQGKGFKSGSCVFNHCLDFPEAHVQLWPNNMRDFKM